jgi:hypothetical protein
LGKRGFLFTPRTITMFLLTVNRRVENYNVTLERD